MLLCWAHKRNDLPDYFCEEFKVVSAVRQIVSAVAVRTQKVERKLKAKIIPYDNGKINNRPIDTDDLFQLVPFTKLCEFPELTKKSSVLLPNGEKILVCESCGGAGAMECEVCNGSHSVMCTHCSGVGELECPKCEGLGEELQGGIDRVSCSRCMGIGIVECNKCHGTCLIECNACRDGTVSCDSCNATGKVKKVWVLSTRSSTAVRHHLYCQNEWISDDDKMALDSVLIQYHDWDNPYTGIEVAEIQRLIPDHLLKPAIDGVRESLTPPSKSRRDTGVRLELRALYIYRVIVKQNGDRSEFFISGCSNRVTPSIFPRKLNTIGSRFIRLIGRMFEIARLIPENTDELDYVEGVNSGDIHLSDSMLMAQTLREMGATVHLTTDGYDVLMGGEAEDQDADYAINISFDYRHENELVVHSSILLGAANRNNFPNALNLNQTITVGFIGLVEEKERLLENFVLVDRRDYSTLSPFHFFYLLKQLVSEAVRIKTEDLLELELYES